MIILGLTGSVAMGKSTVSRMFRDEGIPVHDADASVHRSMRRNSSVFSMIKEKFPEAIAAKKIDRKALGAIVFADKTGAARETLEAILHPVVLRNRNRWIKKQRDNKVPLVVLDIPLLYETGAETFCDKVAVVMATPEDQKARALARGMTEARLHAIRAVQMGDDEKKSRADFIIDTSVSLDETRAQVRKIIAGLGSANP